MVNSNHERIFICSEFIENKIIDMSKDNDNVAESDPNLFLEHEYSPLEDEQRKNLPYSEDVNFPIISNYQILPKKFFNYENIPRPLVRRTWLKKFYELLRSERKGTDISDLEYTSGSDEDSEDDSIPLSSLKLKLIGRKEAWSDDGDGNKSERLSKPIFIQRRRGRPKKQSQPSQVFNPSNNDINKTIDGSSDLSIVSQEKHDEIPDWWNENTNSSDNEVVVQPEPYSEVSLCEIEINEENEYFQQSNEDQSKNDKTSDVNNLNKEKIKESRSEVRGVEMENSKLVFPCVECGKTFSAASTLKYHLRIHNGTLIKCPECDRGFTTNYLLKCHMRIHNGDLFICHKCGRGFTTAELLKVHSRSHTGIRPYSCKVCEKSFPSASNLAQHKQTHEPEKKYLCFQCGSSFSQKRCLDGHMLSHGEKNHICTVCGKLWARKSDLNEHMRVHTGFKPYACSSCPQKFTQASSLRRHQIVHKDANPVQCLTCGKMLKCNEYYKRHMKKHEKEKELQSSRVTE